MKLGDIASAVSGFSRALAASSAQTASERAEVLARYFASRADCEVKDFVKFVRVEAPNKASRKTELTCSVAADTLDVLAKLASGFSAKTLQKGFIQVSRFLRAQGDISIAALGPKVVSASRPKARKGTHSVDRALVDKYFNQLEAALGKDEEFMAVFHELHKDARVTKIEAVDLADRFMGPVAPSTSRSKALQRVLYRHRKLMDFSSGSSSIGGRAA